MLNKFYDFYCKHKGKVVGFLLMYAVVMTFSVFGHVMGGILLSVIIGISKEVFDKVSGRGFGFKNLIAEALGVIFAVLAMIIGIM